ncbi:MAG: hypothetical protein A3K68_03155 [Euryarchaeota archaeon RBG_16_68_13]|nr:MAG: hypothetical protein A3K68_03155 [Euryarchaeota archaeon RBG_16_68_13]
MEPFHPVRKVAAILEGFRRPWWIAGGWAIDLLVERETRAHEDVEVAILRGDQRGLRNHLRGWRLERVVRGSFVKTPWPEGEWIAPPDHEIHARSPDASLELEVLLNEREGDAWRFQRLPEVTRPLVLAGMRTADGVPFLAPEIVLLYKAKDPRERDIHDFRVARGALDEDRRQWLRDALARVHPGHPWIREL